jgi:hypothetical protein
MRGLDIRVNFAKATLYVGIDPTPENADAVLDVLVLASEEGSADFTDGQGELPGMFAGVLDLVRAWNDGWSLAAQMAECAQCDGCSSLAMCPTHD